MVHHSTAASIHAAVGRMMSSYSPLKRKRDVKMSGESKGVIE
jgi:hypothetical protein